MRLMAVGDGVWWVHAPVAMSLIPHAYHTIAIVCP